MLKLKMAFYDGNKKLVERTVELNDVIFNYMFERETSLVHRVHEEAYSLVAETCKKRDILHPKDSK